LKLVLIYYDIVTLLPTRQKKRKKNISIYTYIYIYIYREREREIDRGGEREWGKKEILGSVEFNIVRK